MKLSTKVAYNTFVQIAGKAASTVLGLIAAALIMRHLGQFGFGEYTTIITYLSVFAIMADFGMTLVTVQMTSRKEADENSLLGNIFTFRLLSILLFLGLAPLSVLALPYSHEIKLGVLYGTLIFLFPALNQVLIGIFQKNLRMDKVAIAEIAGRLVLLLGVIFVIIRQQGLYGIILVSALASFINFLLLYLFSRNFTAIKLKLDLRVWKQIFRIAWPIAITITFNLIYLKTDTLILSLIKDQRDVGIYGAAYKIIEVLGTIPFMFAGIILPILTLRWSENEKENFRSILQKSVDVMAILAVPLIIGSQFLAKNVIVLVAGQDFAVSAAPLKILILAMAGLFIGCMPSHAIIAINKQKKIIPAYIFTAITSLVGYSIFIPLYSYMGAAWVTVYSETVIALLSFYIIWKFTGFIPNLNIFYKSLLASLAMAAFLFYLKDAAIWLSLPLAMIVYFIFLYLFKGLDKQDLLDILKRA